MRRILARVLATLVVVVLLAVGAVAYANRQTISDHFAAQQFNASSEIVTLTERLRLTDAGRRVFWASQPTLDASQTFNEQCSNVDHNEEGHVLGCFASRQIHLFKVSDERLDGIIEVTATHELLHATFSRLGTEQRDVLVKKLNLLYKELIVEDPTLEQRMSVYAGLSKVGFANELHSVLGTEIADLPDWLERHYGVWLLDRALILEFFESYHALFEELKLRAEELQTAMADLRVNIEKRSAEYDAAVEQFNTDWEEFLRRNNNFEFSDNAAEFYRMRDQFYERRDTLGAEMRSLNSDIELYEEMRAELLQLSELNHELEQRLDSDLAPPASALADQLEGDA